MLPRRRLGRTDLEVTPIGLGCWQFSGGVGMTGNYWGRVGQEVTSAIVRASLAGGIDWFDTAEIYGSGRSERALATALTAAGKKPGDVVVATKWWPMLRRASDIGATIGERLACLSPYPIDLYQVHQPLALATVGAQMTAMADLVRAKKIRAVGVSNFSARRMRAAHDALRAYGLPLATNQMPYSLLDRRIETNGVFAAAKSFGVGIIAYSPLAQGMLTGRYHDDPASLRAQTLARRAANRLRGRSLEQSRPVVDELRAIAKAHGATPAQVALAWTIQFHGDVVVAIPGATKERQVADNVGALSLTLGARELGRLDELSRRFR